MIKISLVKITHFQMGHLLRDGESTIYFKGTGSTKETLSQNKDLTLTSLETMKPGVNTCIYLSIESE